MGVYHWLQLVLGAAVMLVALRRTQALCFEAAADAAPLLRQVRQALETGEAASAKRIADAASDSWVGRTLRLGFDAPEELEEHLADVRYRAMSGLDALKVLARVGTATGLLGMVGYVLWMLNGDHGLMGLQAGWAEAQAMRGAMIAAGIGVSIAIVGFSAASALQKVARQRLDEVRRARDLMTAFWRPPEAAPTDSDPQEPTQDVPLGLAKGEC